MKYLCLGSLSNLSSVDFVKNMPNLIELDIRGTSVTDLSVLEEYSTSLLGLWIDNPAIDLTEIQKTISKLDYGAGNSLAWTAWRPGLGITNLELMKKLGNCTEITDLDIYNLCNSNVISGKLDLSGCSNLKNILFGGSGNLNMTLILPSIINTVSVCRANYLDFVQGGKCGKIEIVWSGYDQEKLDSTLINLAKLSKISSLRFQPTIGWQGNDISKLSNLSDKGLKEFYFMIADNDTCTGTGIEDLSGLQDWTSLTTLTFNKTIVNNISALKNLVNLKTLDLSNNKIINITGLEGMSKLEKLVLSNNQISNLYPLKNLNALQSLYLEDNLIYDTSSDPDGVPFNNLQLLANLNQKGNLKNLFLKGNKAIVSYSPLLNLAWSNRSGF